MSSKNHAKPQYWAIRGVNIIGGVVVTMVILWQTGLTSHVWWDRFSAPKPPVVAKAPARPTNKPIGITPTTPKGNDTSVSPVPLPLILVSIKLGSNLHGGSAQIGVVRESPQTYQAGALLENGARLAEIHSDYVLLQKGARSLRLYLDGSMQAEKVSESAMLSVGGPKEKSAPAKITSREVLTDYIRPTPMYDGDNVVGYQVYPGSKPGPFAQMGLHGGDVIIEIDGTPLTDPAVAWEILRQVSQGSVLDAVVKRGSDQVRVTLDGSLIAAAEDNRSMQVTQAMLSPLPPPH